MIDPQPDVKSQYGEGCSALRHYSLCVLNTRTITIAQGFVLLTAAAYLIKERAFALSAFVSLFGLLFTHVLKKLQENYWLHFEAILRAIVKIEHPSSKGPWRIYAKQRWLRHKRTQWRVLVVNGPSNLLLIACLAILGFDTYNLSTFWFTTYRALVVVAIIIKVITVVCSKWQRRRTSKRRRVPPAV